MRINTEWGANPCDFVIHDRPRSRGRAEKLFASARDRRYGILGAGGKRLSLLFDRRDRLDRENYPDMLSQRDAAALAVLDR